MTSHRRRYQCRFCPVGFEEDVLATLLCHLYCPSCRALYMVAVEAVLRAGMDLDVDEMVERVGDCSVVILSGLPVRGERAA